MLSPSLLLQAYATGWFPMGSEQAGPDGVEWFSPDPRALIPLDGRFHVPRRLRRVLRSDRFTVEVDRAFPDVMQACARRDDTWITGTIERAYLDLHRLGFAHSVEVWREGRLAGGLYGVALRGAFFGESMFHHDTDASKVALCALVERLRARGYVLLDTQWRTEHLAQFGAYEVARRRYLRLLAAAMKHDCHFAGLD